MLSSLRMLECGTLTERRAVIEAAIEMAAATAALTAGAMTARTVGGSIGKRVGNAEAHQARSREHHIVSHKKPFRTRTRGNGETVPLLRVLLVVETIASLETRRQAARASSDPPPRRGRGCVPRDCHLR